MKLLLRVVTRRERTQLSVRGGRSARGEETMERGDIGREAKFDGGSRV